ncbi:MAG: hypothetical protein PHV37_01285 [Candidatus Gastranaerophilales bacterium]|nr:hypothetical protein [Candidatus Gastranaerophilales bacterium]
MDKILQEKTAIQLDCIRDFVRHKLKSKGLMHIYNTYWLGMEVALSELEVPFLIDYLTIQNNGKVSKIHELFDDFKSFFLSISRYKNNEQILKHIYRYSSYYKRIVEADVEDLLIREKIETINSYEAVDTYSYLMEVFEDYEFVHISKKMLLEILNTIIMFVKERAIQNLDSKDMSFANLSSQINKMLTLKNFAPMISSTEEPTSLNEVPKTINDIMEK